MKGQDWHGRSTAPQQAPSQAHVLDRVQLCVGKTAQRLCWESLKSNNSLMAKHSAVTCRSVCRRTCTNITEVASHKLGMFGKSACLICQHRNTKQNSSGSFIDAQRIDTQLTGTYSQ